MPFTAKSRFALGAIVILAACAKTEGEVAFDPSALHAEGKANYSTQLLKGEHGPSNHDGSPARPKVTARFKGPPPTNEWWSSLMWAYDGDPFSRAMFPHPLSVKAEAAGLGIGYATVPALKAREYRFPFQRDLLLSTSDLHAPDARVDSASDWAVTAAWDDGPHKLDATFGHGLPFVYVHSSGDARIDAGADAQVWAERGEVFGISAHGHDYGLFAPTGAPWHKDGTAFVSPLGGKGFYSVAVLPDHTPETLELFRKHAYAFVTGTRASWKYDARAAKVTSHFEVKTSLVEPGADRVDEPLLALYPHQWKATHAAVSSAAYVSPRGPMKLLAAGAFDVERPYHGVLPILPEAMDDVGRIRSHLKDEAGSGNLFPLGLEGVKDTYWDGKSLGRVASLAWIASQLGETDIVARLTQALEAELDDWFDGTPPRRFYYDATWKTLIGFPAGYQSGTQMNDHHFHYGYFVWAAATVAALAPERKVLDRWGPFVRMLIKDVANTDDADARFPRLRSFDPYAGHSWASGAAMFDHGNNEESSSEDENFAAAVVLWGSVTHDDAARDLGVFLYETLASAIEQYWLDVDHDVFPKGYDHPVAGIVWGDGVVYDTWWDRNPIYVHGINVLPVTGASLYLGRRLESLRTDEQHLLQQNRGPIHQWRDVMWMYQALGDAAQAGAAVDDDHYFDPEFGNSWAMTMSWVHSLQRFGHVDPAVLGDTTSYAVFRGEHGRTYAAYNPGAAPLHVTFDDGATLDVPPGAMRTSPGPNGSH